MKRGWIMFLLLMGFAFTAAAHAQVSAYGEFSASNLPNGPKGNYLYGGSAGVLIDGPKVFHRIVVSADIDGRFVSKSGERLDSVTVGPRFTIGPYKTISPYGSFDVGFARYNDGSNNATTDYLYGGSFGLAKPVSSRLDVFVEYKIESYGAIFNMYSPSTYSAGVMFHFVKR